MEHGIEGREIRQEIRRRGSWLIPLGVLLAVLGGVAIVGAFATTIATVLFFGVLLVVGGIAQLAQALVDRGEDFGWDVASALLYLFAGGLLVLDPVSGAIGLTLLLAGFFLFVGATRISLGMKSRRRHGFGGLFVFTGVLDLLLGLLIILGWPATGAWVIGLFLGIELLLTGVSLVVVTLAVRRGSGPASLPERP